MSRDIGNYLTQITQSVDYWCRIHYRHGQREDRMDITSEVALIAHENRHKVIERSETEFLAWLHEIARNVIRNWSRRERTIWSESLGSIDDDSLRDNLPSNSQAPESDVLAQERLEAVREAIRDLPLIHQQVVWLFYIEDLPEKEIAKRLGIRKGTVKSRLYHARKQLAALLESYFVAD